MRKASSSLLALVLACAQQAASASEAAAAPAAGEYRPAARSTLVSSRELVFLVAQSQRGQASTTVLALQRPGAEPDPVARLLQLGPGPEWRVSVQLLPVSDGTQARTERELAALEQIYTWVLRLEPLARYCLGSDAAPCDAARDGVSHAQVLQALADARDRAAEHGVGAAGAVPWRVVEISTAPTRSWDADVVGVRATVRQAPLEGVAIYFNRAPHSLCVARTRADGVAICRLEDQHGDGHEHDHATAVVATFPGDVRSDRVLLPTTHVLPQLRAMRTPFGSPGKP